MKRKRIACIYDVIFLAKEVQTDPLLPLGSPCLQGYIDMTEYIARFGVYWSSFFLAEMILNGFLLSCIVVFSLLFC